MPITAPRSEIRLAEGGEVDYGVRAPVVGEGGNYKISTTFWREVWPEMIFTLTEPIPKWTARALMTARLAMPFTGGSFTDTTKSVSLIFSTLSSLAFGLALTLILIYLDA